MTIRKEQYERIIRSLQLGNPVAENDNILEEARVDTPVFQGFITGEYDIVTGRKGAGKTAIFKIVSETLKTYFLVGQRRVILTGVNSTGDSVFLNFKEQFEKFSEADFENFWKIYFVTLIYNDFLKNPLYADALTGAEDEIEAFKRACFKAGIPEFPARLGRKEMIGAILTKFPKLQKVKGSLGADANATLFGGTFEIELQQEDEKATQRTSLYVNEIGEIFKKILEKTNYRVWLVLDRLDEVFDRYSKEEFNGLRGLLKAYRSFDLGNSEFFGIKIFLRDDIKEFLTDDKIFKKHFKGKTIPPFPAATHIFSKESPVLNWSQDEIEKLILYRLLLSDELRNYLGTKAKNREEVAEELRSKEKRLEYWNKIFPEKISKSPSLNWIFTRLRDSNGVVTPRSVIDLLNGAVDFQKQNLQTDFRDSSDIITEEAIKYGHAIASKRKLENDIYNEFPNDQINIKKLADGKGKLSRKDLEKIYGKEWESTVERLRRIGILRLVIHSNDYMIEFLFRPALNIVYKY